MALVIEDGSIVVGANSYATRAVIIAYALARSIVLADSAVTDGFAIDAMDYLLRYSRRWKGSQVEPGVQALDWPRECVRSGSYTFPSDAIPAALISAQSQLAMYRYQGISLLPVSGQTAFITREKIGPLETEFSEAVQLQSGLTPSLPAIDAILSGLLDGGGRLRSVRI